MTATTLNGQRHPMQSSTNYAVECFAKLTGGGASTDLVNSDSAIRGGGEIVSAVWSSTGTYTVTFRKSWPALLYPPVMVPVGATADFNLEVSAIDVVAGTATFIFNSNTTPADVATTTTCYLRWTVLAVNKR